MYASEKLSLLVTFRIEFWDFRWRFILIILLVLGDILEGRPDRFWSKYVVLFFHLWTVLSLTFTFSQISFVVSPAPARVCIFNLTSSLECIGVSHFGKNLKFFEWRVQEKINFRFEVNAFLYTQSKLSGRSLCENTQKNYKFIIDFICLFFSSSKACLHFFERMANCKRRWACKMSIVPGR